MNDTYFDTLSETLDGVQRRLDADQIDLQRGGPSCLPDDHWTTDLSEPVSYGQVVQSNFEIRARKGRATRAWFHVVITRLDTGTYELVAHVL